MQIFKSRKLFVLIIVGLYILLSFTVLSLNAKTFYIPDEDISALTKALREADKTPEVDTISLARFGHYTLISNVHEHHEISLLPAIHSEVYVKGNFSIFQGVGKFKHSLFRIERTGSLQVNNLIVSYFDTKADGGIFYCKGILGANNCEFFGNHAHKGGVIYNTHYGFISLINSALIGNRAGSSHNSKRFHGGGAIFNHGKMQIIHVTFQKNHVVNQTASEDVFHAGGAIFNTGHDVVLRDCNFFGNHANSKGAQAGAVWHQNHEKHSFEVLNCSFQNNEADNGGAVRCKTVSPTHTQVSETEFINNSPHLDFINYEIEKLNCKNCSFAGS